MVEEIDGSKSTEKMLPWPRLNEASQMMLGNSSS